MGGLSDGCGGKETVSEKRELIFTQISSTVKGDTGYRLFGLTSQGDVWEYDTWSKEWYRLKMEAHEDKK